MRKVLKKNKWFVLTILVIVGWFYWFQYRPSNMQSACAQSAKDKANEELRFIADRPGGGWGAIDEAAHSGRYNDEDYRFYYEQCLNEHGLK